MKLQLTDHFQRSEQETWDQPRKGYTDLSKRFYATQIESLLGNSRNFSSKPLGSALKVTVSCLHLGGNCGSLSDLLLITENHLQSTLQILTCLTLTYKAGSINLQNLFNRWENWSAERFSNLPKVKHLWSGGARILTPFGYWAIEWYLTAHCSFTVMRLQISPLDRWRNRAFPRTHCCSEDLQPSIVDCKACSLSISTTPTQHLLYDYMDLKKNAVTSVGQCQEGHTMPIQKWVCLSWLIHQGLGCELQPISSKRSSMKTLLSITLR